MIWCIMWRLYSEASIESILMWIDLVVGWNDNDDDTDDGTDDGGKLPTGSLKAAAKTTKAALSRQQRFVLHYNQTTNPHSTCVFTKRSG